jgi:uncharacterized protein with HEPN domain
MLHDEPSRDAASLLDMLRACRLIRDFVAGLDRSTFLSDAKTKSAVLHQLLILGEAAKRVSAQTRAQFPSIPWRSITGMRDVLIHDYDDVDLEQVWQTVTCDIAPLVHVLEARPSPTAGS